MSARTPGEGERGYFSGVAEKVGPGTLYFYSLDEEKDRPDPVSRFQPQDVHGPSEVVSEEFAWEDENWFGIPLSNISSMSCTSGRTHATAPSRH